MNGLPLTGSDLRVIADAVDAVDHSELAKHAVLGRFEVYRPEGDDQIGWVERFDQDLGWGYIGLGESA